MRRLSIIPGEVFGRWTALGDAPSRGRHRYALVRCACGTERAVQIPALVRGRSTSCRGCWKNPNRTHEMSTSKTYRIWADMIGRCTRPSNVYGVLHYQNRGITVCDRWRYSFENFLADMGERPSGLTLDRVNNDGNYEPGNCRWATRKEQMRNTRRQCWVTYNGQRMTMVEACQAAGIRQDVVFARASRKGITKQESFDHYAARS